MGISSRKVEYNGKRVFVFDLIVKDPEWVCHNILDSLTPAEVSFYNAYRKPEPVAQIEINADDFTNIINPYLSEAVCSELPIAALCDNMVSDINEYNRRLKSWHKSYGFSRPYWYLNCDASKPLVPPLYNVERFASNLRTKLQYIQQKYKKGKVSEEIYQSMLRFRDNLNEISNLINKKLIEYGSTLQPYFTEWEEWNNEWNSVQNILEEFRKNCHYRGIMGFGKYYNKSISYVIRKDINYIKWALKNKPDFILRGDDLEEFIEKEGYNPYANSAYTTYPSNETIVDLASLLGDSCCELNSVVFKTSYLPNTKTLLSLTEKYPSLRYNITSKGNSYLITISGDFKIGTSQEEPLVILKESTEPVFSMDEDNKRLIF